MDLSLKEAAKVLGISLSTARRWIKAGRLRATLKEGPYGPEYIVTQEELDRVKGEQSSPVTVILPDPRDQQGVMVPKEWLAQAMRQAFEEALARYWAGVEHELRRELEELRQELAATRELLAKQEEERRLAEAERDRLLAERDRRLVEEIRQVLREKRKPWWKFW